MICSCVVTPVFYGERTKNLSKLEFIHASLIACAVAEGSTDMLEYLGCHVEQNEQCFYFDKFSASSKLKTLKPSQLSSTDCTQTTGQAMPLSCQSCIYSLSVCVPCVQHSLLRLK